MSGPLKTKITNDKKYNYLRENEVFFPSKIFSSVPRGNYC